MTEEPRAWKARTRGSEAEVGGAIYPSTVTLVKRQTPPMSGFFLFFPLFGFRCGQSSVLCSGLISVFGRPSKWRQTRIEVLSSLA
jgi:hypothetical protein